MMRWPRSDEDAGIWLAGMAYGLGVVWLVVLLVTFWVGSRP